MIKKAAYVLSLTGSIAAFFINYLIVEDLIIPDPCYYHARDTTMIFDLFYTLKIADGGHPSPTILNYLLTIGAGGLLGLAVSNRTFRSSNK